MVRRPRLPRRNRHDEIPLESRIVALADALPILVMDVARSYCRTATSNEAMEQIVAGSGTQFDPELVTAFTAMLGGHRARVAQSA